MTIRGYIILCCRGRRQEVFNRGLCGSAVGVCVCAGGLTL